MKYKIITDSSADLLQIPGGIDYCVAPLKVVAGEREFVDDDQLDVSQMLEYLEGYKGKSGSSCPSVADYLEAFGDADRIFCVTITSNLSGSYNAARLAKEDYEAAHPERKVFVVDSLSAGPELKLIVEKALDGIGSGKEFETICQEITAYQQHTKLLFSLESLRNLANNGRVSPVVAKIAGVLGIRVVGKASDVGTLEPMDKCRGEKKAMEKIVARMAEMGCTGGKVRIDHCRNLPAAQLLAELIRGKWKNSDILIDITHGLCSFYAEKGGLLVGFEV